MALERTFSIIKPDATRRNLTGAINDVIEKGGLRIVASATGDQQQRAGDGQDGTQHAGTPEQERGR